MKLKDDFFHVKNACQTATGMDYAVELNPEHFIYKAHFPENPITPGVCIIQIVKELSKEILQRELFLKKVNNVKFLNVINPQENKEITFSITVSSEGYAAHKIGAVVSGNGSQFAKLSLLFVNIERQ
jgi:3-hydroxyacyl-[acyl-carrier-protein] dehydratase